MLFSAYCVYLYDEIVWQQWELCVFQCAATWCALFCVEHSFRESEFAEITVVDAIGTHGSFDKSIIAIDRKEKS